MPHKAGYPQLPSTIVYAPPPNRLWGFFKWFRNILAVIGFLLVVSLVFLYFQGQQVTRSFNNEFISVFGKFIEHVLKKDVASAMLIKTPVQQGIKLSQAIKAMKQHARQLNLKFIGNYPLYKEIQASTGKPFRFVEIFEFYDATVAAFLLNHNSDIAAYLPYRIALYEDISGKIWLATLNSELLLHGPQGIDPKLKVQVLKVQESLLKIMGAGAYGTL